MALKPPVEVPQGAIRLNTDSQKLEFYAQDQWWEMATDIPNLGGGGSPSSAPTGNSADQVAGVRGLMGGGQSKPAGAKCDNINYLNIASTGDTIDFGDMTGTRNALCGGVGSRTRGIFAGGDGDPTYSNTIDYVTIASVGNATDFGDMTERFGSYGEGSAGNQTRGVWFGNRDQDDSSPFSASYNNRIDYVQIATTGNAQDFGDLTRTCSLLQGAFSSSTRAFAAGGGNPSVTNIIDQFTIATTGNATDFGDLQMTWYRGGGCANSTRGVMGGGQDPDGLTNNMCFITMSTMGNAAHFGQLSVGMKGEYTGALASPIRGVWAGTSSPLNNQMEYVSMVTTGDAVDFGDISAGGMSEKACLTNGHGGL